MAMRRWPKRDAASLGACAIANVDGGFRFPIMTPRLKRRGIQTDLVPPKLAHYPLRVVHQFGDG